ncbi:hypothetical protein I317_01077 [Kwoniella heveanensis CBS 569]|nr:hypothetical protein I317_01077 [Kwoniella heveanensis CBS 569]
MRYPAAILFLLTALSTASASVVSSLDTRVPSNKVESGDILAATYDDNLSSRPFSKREEYNAQVLLRVSDNTTASRKGDDDAWARPTDESMRMTFVWSNAARQNASDSGEARLDQMFWWNIWEPPYTETSRLLYVTTCHVSIAVNWTGKAEYFLVYNQLIEGEKNTFIKFPQDQHIKQKDVSVVCNQTGCNLPEGCDKYPAPIWTNDFVGVDRK